MLIKKIYSLAIGATAVASTGAVASYMYSNNKPERVGVIRKYNLDKYGPYDLKVDADKGWYLDF